MSMYVIKRDGRKEPIMFDKITARIKKLCYGFNELIDPVRVAMRVIEGLYDGVTTSELDNLAAEIAATMTTTHPDYASLAARISVSNLHKNTTKSFSDTMKDLHAYVNPITGKKAPLLSDEVYKVIKKNAELLDSKIIYNRDFGYDYFGFKTLERSYLLKINGKIVERPQHMLMRVSVGIHLNDIDAVIDTYELMSKKYFTHATPTLFHSGTPRPQLLSCFLLGVEDSVKGMPLASCMATYTLQPPSGDLWLKAYLLPYAMHKALQVLVFEDEKHGRVGSQRKHFCQAALPHVCGDDV